MIGYFVLLMLYMNDVLLLINCLMNMGVELFFVVMLVYCVVVQCFVCWICIVCKEFIEVLLVVLMNVGFDESEVSMVQFFCGKGCEKCSNIGYKGCIVFYECMVFDDEICEFVFSGVSVYEVCQKVLQFGMILLCELGFYKICNGVMMIEEVVCEIVG